MIQGNLEGIKKVYIEALENLYEIQCDKNLIVSEEILEVICDISEKINKEISVYINRRGKVVDVSVGDNSTVSLEAQSEKRGSMGLCGIRCIHTHPGGNSMLSSADATALINLRFDCMAAVSFLEGKADKFTFGYLNTEKGQIRDKVSYDGPYSVFKIHTIDVLHLIQGIEEGIYDKSHEIYDDEKERVILVGGITDDLYSTEESLNELEELVETAGAEAIQRVVQNKSNIDTAYYIGSGKARELALLRQSMLVDTVVFDDELTGAQVRNLEELIGCKIIDRTTLILDIFAQRAKSSEGKVQVELAQLKYRLPRLSGLGKVLSRTGGGIGSKGPGEKKLEIDKRHIRERIYDLESQLKNMKKTRNLQRERRKANEIPMVSLAGYTNAGKSTLRNKLCQMAGIDKEDVFEANMLFATLDTTTRSINLPSGKGILLSDTVGFIRKLPHDLVEAFKSTLEEVAYSDLIVHVVDASNPNAVAQIQTVENVLREIGADDKKVLLALNKIDSATNENIGILRTEYPDAIEISALDGTNLDFLLKSIDSELFKDFVQGKLLIPYSEGNVISFLHNNNCVELEEYRDNGIYVEIKTTKDVFGKVKEYVVEE